MDTKSIGNTISKLRKKHGMTQLQMAQRLNISDKTVSKWESGQGYPDVTAFPLLAALFGVSIDYLMLGERKGIAIAGNLIADIVKNIDLSREEFGRYYRLIQFAYENKITGYYCYNLY